jgi:hypothetical protein
MSEQDRSGVGTGVAVAIVGIGVLGSLALFAAGSSHIGLGIALGCMVLGLLWGLHVVSPGVLQTLVRWLLWWL